MKGKPGTRANITPRGHLYIDRRAREYPRISRRELAKALQKEIEEKGWDVPEVEVLEKLITKYRNKPEGPEDKPWNILTLADYEIEADALPTVFELWAYALREYKEPLTIREMRWAARLYRIVKNDLVGLLLLSSEYAAYERSKQVLGDKVASIAEEIGFRASTELYVDTHRPELTSEELVKEDSGEILKRKCQNLLNELRSPEILEVLKIRAKQKKQKGGESK